MQASRLDWKSMCDCHWNVTVLYEIKKNRHCLKNCGAICKKKKTVPMGFYEYLAWKECKDFWFSIVSLKKLKYILIFDTWNPIPHEANYYNSFMKSMYLWVFEDVPRDSGIQNTLNDNILQDSHESSGIHAICDSVVRFRELLFGVHWGKLLKEAKSNGNLILNKRGLIEFFREAMDLRDGNGFLQALSLSKVIKVMPKPLSKG